jgi:hypothetical protein
MKALFWKIWYKLTITRDQRAMIMLATIIRWIKRDLNLQKTSFKHKDYKDAQAISQEIIDCLEELGL